MVVNQIDLIIKKVEGRLIFRDMKSKLHHPVSPNSTS